MELETCNIVAVDDLRTTTMSSAYLDISKQQKV